MTQPLSSAVPTPARGRQIVLERLYRGAHVEDVWDLWTTKDGIESWWGPGGFAVTVHRMDLRPGGELFYAMTAKDPQMVAYMQKEGMPVSQDVLITYVEVSPQERLVYQNLVDFVPGTEPYEVATKVELLPEEGAVRMVLTLDAMHDEEWTNRAAAGWEQELDKLVARLEALRSAQRQL